MTTLGPLFALPLHVASWKRPLIGSSRNDFRITNGYTGVDLINGGLHLAVDAGNKSKWNTGVDEAILAPIDCYAHGYMHSDGALVLILGLAPELEMRVAHCNRIDVTMGKWQAVKAGQQIGLTGNTGRQPMPGHAHVELWHHGSRIDPEPYLDIVESPPQPLPEEDMKLSGTFVRHVVNRQGRLTANANFRAGVTPTDNAPIAVLPATALFIPTVVVRGTSAGTAPDKDEWFGGIKTAVPGQPGDWFGYVHSSVLPRTPDGSGVALEPIEAGFTAEDMANAKVQGRAEMKRECELAVAKVPA